MFKKIREKLENHFFPIGCYGWDKEDVEDMKKFLKEMDALHNKEVGKK